MRVAQPAGPCGRETGAPCGQATVERLERDRGWGGGILKEVRKQVCNAGEKLGLPGEIPSH